MAGRRPERPPGAEPAGDAASEERCDYCGATALVWRKCKLVCENCHNIVKSCADL
jgi:hypothetical protein